MHLFVHQIYEILMTIENPTPVKGRGNLHV